MSIPRIMCEVCSVASPYLYLYLSIGLNQTLYGFFTQTFMGRGRAMKKAGVDADWKATMRVSRTKISAMVRSSSFHCVRCHDRRPGIGSSIARQCHRDRKGEWPPPGNSAASQGIHSVGFGAPFRKSMRRCGVRHRRQCSQAPGGKEELLKHMEDKVKLREICKARPSQCRASLV